MPSEAFLLGMLRSLFGNQAKLAPIFATYDLLPNVGPQFLMESLMRTCIDFRANQVLRPQSKARANAATGDKGGGKARGKGTTLVPSRKPKAKQAQLENRRKKRKQAKNGQRTRNHECNANPGWYGTSTKY